MPTLYQHRATLIVPAAQQAAINTFCTNQLDPSGGPWFTVPLNASGLKSDPVTHYWCSAALTHQDIHKLLIRLATLASLTPPAGTLTRKEKAQWVIDNRAAILAATGIRCVRDDNDGVWSDPRTALTAHGLKVITTGAP